MPTLGDNIPLSNTDIPIGTVLVPDPSRLMVRPVRPDGHAYIRAMMFGCLEWAIVKRNVMFLDRIRQRYVLKGSLICYRVTVENVSIAQFYV